MVVIKGMEKYLGSVKKDVSKYLKSHSDVLSPKFKKNLLSILDESIGKHLSGIFISEQENTKDMKVLYTLADQTHHAGSIYNLEIWFFEHPLEYAREEIESISSKVVEELQKKDSEEYPINVVIETLTKKLGLKEVIDHNWEFTGPYSKIVFYSFTGGQFE